MASMTVPSIRWRDFSDEIFCPATEIEPAEGRPYLRRPERAKSPQDEGNFAASRVGPCVRFPNRAPHRGASAPDVEDDAKVAGTCERPVSPSRPFAGAAKRSTCRSPRVFRAVRIYPVSPSHPADACRPGFFRALALQTPTDWGKVEAVRGAYR